MFPKSFLFFIFITAIDLILKSMKDKKKIDESRAKRAEKLNKKSTKVSETIPYKKISSPNVKQRTDNIIKEEKEKPEEKGISFEMKSRWEEPIFTEPYKEEIKSRVEKKISDTKLRKSKKQMKEDILRGIIYSEILSEPKSLRNRKSM